MLAIFLSVLPWPARATAEWLVLEGSCDASADAIARRIEGELAGVRPEALSLAIELAAGTPVRGNLHVLANARVVGEKQVEARTCEEALYLLSAIAALALSSFPAPEAAQHTAAEERAPPNGGPASDSPPSPSRTSRAMRLGGDAAARSRAGRWRALATAGISLGAGAPTTLLVAGGAGATLGPGELRLVGRYGAPSSTEDVETVSLSTRRDFGSAALDYCYGLDAARRLSLCAGWEVLTRRERRAVEGMAGRVEQTRRQPLFGPVLGLALVLRRVVAQPQLELSALVPVWGAPPSFGFRAALGGGLPF